MILVEILDAAAVEHYDHRGGFYGLNEHQVMLKHVLYFCFIFILFLCMCLVAFVVCHLLLGSIPKRHSLTHLNWAFTIYLFIFFVSFFLFEQCIWNRI